MVVPHVEQLREGSWSGPPVQGTAQRVAALLMGIRYDGPSMETTIPLGGSRYSAPPTRARLRRGCGRTIWLHLT
ncbi:hypothetical protein [Mycobacterium sp. URHB0021]